VVIRVVAWAERCAQGVDVLVPVSTKVRLDADAPAG
jgi:hypothetical protein